MGDKAYKLAGRRILIVEDELLIAMDLEYQLEEHDVQVIGPASTVEAAIGLIESEKPDGVLLDLNLDGVRTTPIAEQLNTRDIPFVLLTGYVESVTDEPALTDVPLVQKPWSRTELLATLSKAIEIKKT